MSTISSGLAFTFREALENPYNQDYNSIDKLSQSDDVSLFGAHNCRERIHARDGREKIKLTWSLTNKSRVISHFVIYIGSKSGTRNNQKTGILKVYISSHDRQPFNNVTLTATILLVESRQPLMIEESPLPWRGKL
jgi:hypothetical protein